MVESGNPPLEIELSSDTGRIAGTVKGPHSGLVLVERIGTPRFFAAFRALLTEDGGFLTDELAPGLYEVRCGGATGRAEVKTGETTRLDLQVPER